VRIGLLEIVLIIVVVIAAALIARVVRPGRVPSTTPAGAEDTPGRDSPGTRSLFNKTGIVLVLGGFVALAAAMSLFRWVLQSYLWALILIAGGTIMLLLARRRR
jgi:hypothetical protein